MKLIIAITKVATEFPILENAVRDAINNGGNDEIELINSILEQHKESESIAKFLEDKLGKDVIKCFQDWANSKSVEQDYFIMNECLKEDKK